MRQIPRCLLFFVLTTAGLPSMTRAEIITERQAAEETEVKGLRLLGTGTQASRLTILGIHLGYVENDTKMSDSRIFCGAISRDKSRPAGEKVATALLKLPASSIQNLGLKYVILCSGMTRTTAAEDRRIGGIPLPRLNLLLLDTGESGNTISHIDRIFLHELYHFMEIRLNTLHDKDWQKRFGVGYANSYEGRTNKPKTIGGGGRGFLNAYSVTYPHEERAELFAHLVLNPAEVVTHIRLKDDELLKRKTLYLVEKCERLFGIDIALPGMY